MRDSEGRNIGRERGRGACGPGKAREIKAGFRALILKHKLMGRSGGLF